MNDIIELVHQLNKKNISIPKIGIDDINLERIDIWLAEVCNINIIIWTERDNEYKINNWVYEVFDISNTDEYVSLKYSVKPIYSKREAKIAAIKDSLVYLLNR